MNFHRWVRSDRRDDHGKYHSQEYEQNRQDDLKMAATIDCKTTTFSGILGKNFLNVNPSNSCLKPR
jgi:hypothetical protein